MFGITISGYRRKVGKHGRRNKNGNRATGRRLRDYEKTYVTTGGGTLSGGVSGSCRLLYDGHRRSAYEPPTNSLPVGQLALQGMSSSGTMFIDPDPLCPSHGHLCMAQERTRHSARRHLSAHNLLLPLDRWDCPDAGDTTKGARAEPRCPGCDRRFTAADVCHCDCTRPDVADVDRPLTLPSPALNDGSSARAPTPTPPPVGMLQTDDLKLQKTRRKSGTGTNATSAAARKQSSPMSLQPTDDVNSSAAGAGHHAGEVEPLLVTAAVPYDDEDEDEDEAGEDGELTPPLRVIGNAICRNVDQRIDYTLTAT